MFKAYDRALIGRALEGPGESGVKQFGIGIVAPLLHFGQDHLALGVQIGLPEQRIKGQIAHRFHSRLPPGGRQIGQINGLVVRRGGVEIASGAFQSFIHALGAGFGPLEHHVFQQVADTGLLRTFPGRTGFDVQPHRSQRKTMIFVHEHGQSVLQAKDILSRGRPG